jgi:hypothetical protein
VTWKVVQKNRKDARARQASVRAAYLDARTRAETSVADDALCTVSALQGSGLKKEGWLAKLSNARGVLASGPGLQRWKRKWFVVEGGRLGYRRDAKSTQRSDTKGNLDLLLTTVKLQSFHPKGRASERAFTFEVRRRRRRRRTPMPWRVACSPPLPASPLCFFTPPRHAPPLDTRAPSCKVICASPQTHWQLQAESEQDRREWAHALQTVTANLLGISVPHAPTAKAAKATGEGSGGSSSGGSHSGHGMGSGMSLLEEVPAFKSCCECG